MALTKKTTTKKSPITQSVADDFVSTFLSKFPFGELIVFGEKILSVFIPQWEEIKKEIVYFITYAEYVSQKEGQKGKEKKEQVVNFIYQKVDPIIPDWIPRFLIDSVIGMLIDSQVKILNESFPGWETQVSKYFESKVQSSK